jgi:2-polyprenyl-3-methyl-5-hydroxy-6-metoxy-1,4-benzoquinol methylase
MSDLVGKSKLGTPCICSGQGLFKYRLHEFDFYNCEVCTLHFVHPRPPVNQMYDSAYFSGGEQGHGYANYELDKKGQEKFYLKLLRKIRKHDDSLVSVLDVGCANGYFVDLAQREGFESFGIDIADSAISWGKRLNRNVRKASIHDLNLDYKYDVISALDVIEHLPDPITFMTAAYELLNKSGIVVINVPNFGSFYSRLRGKNWHALIPPEHYFFFNKKAMSSMLNRLDFQIVSMQSVSKTLPIRYILTVILSSPQFSPKIKSFAHFLTRILHPKIASLNIKVPIFDNLLVIAQKR